MARQQVIDLLPGYQSLAQADLPRIDLAGTDQAVVGPPAYLQPLGRVILAHILATLTVARTQGAHPTRRTLPRLIHHFLPLRATIYATDVLTNTP